MLSCVGGIAMALKSHDVDDELRDTRTAIEALGGAVRECLPVTVPTTDIERRLVVVEKVSPTPPEYPRSAKAIRRRPL